MLLQCPPKSRRLQIRRGASLVEFAVVASIFFVIIMGIVEFGRAFMVLHLLTNVAREGCRTGVIEGNSTQNIKDLISTRLKDQGMKTQVVDVQVNGVATDAATAKKGDSVTVSVTIPVADVSWLPGSQWVKGNLMAKYTLRRE